MFDPLLRPLKDRLLHPMARRMVGTAPATLTLASLVAGLGAAGAAWRGAFGIGLALWAANRVLDGLDGAVARLHGKVTDFGGYLDLVVDFVVYAAVPIALALRPGADPRLPAAALALIGAFYVNAAAWMVPAALIEKRRRAGGPRGPTSIAIPEGLVSGGETVLFYGLFFLLPDRQVLLFQTMAALTGTTVVQRVFWGRHAFGSRSLAEAPEPESHEVHTGSYR